MNHQSPLDVPELLHSILSYFYDDPAHHKKRPPCIVSRLWFRIGHPFLWRSVTLPAVLKLLADDAWFLYKPAQYKEDAQTAALTGDYAQSAKDCKPAQPLTLVLRRPITPPEWNRLMRYTKHVNSLKTVGTYFYPGDQVGVHGSAYEVLARSIPSDFPVFPNLEELYVTFFGDTPEALALFGGTKLRVLNFEDAIQNTDAAVCIAAFLERQAPLQHIILENVMNVWGALDLTNALPECEALQSLEIHWLVPTLWPGIGALPELKRLLVSAEKPALGMFPEPATTMTTLPFRALTTLKIRSGLPFDDFRRILQTRPLSAPWELECLAFLGPISLGGSVPSHMLYDLVRTRVSTATLKRLALNVVEEPTTDDPFFSIEPIFGFRGLTRLCLLSRFLNEFYYPPLTAEQVKQLAESFPDMENMYVDVLFPLTQLLSLALGCPKLVRLRLTGYMEESWYRYEEPTLKPPADYYHGLRALNLGGDAADPAVVRYYTTVFRRARTDWSITDDAILEEGYWKDE